MLHNRIQKQLSAYLDDELSPRRRRRVERHLLVCEECSALLHELREISDSVASLRKTAPEDLWFMINAKLENVSSDLRRSLATNLRWTWEWIQPIIKPVPIAIGIALIVCGIFIQIFLRERSEISPQYTPIDVYLTAYTQYYSQEMLVPDPMLNLVLEQGDGLVQLNDNTASDQQEQKATYSSEIDFYLSVYLGEDEI